MSPGASVDLVGNTTEIMIGAPDTHSPYGYVHNFYANIYGENADSPCAYSVMYIILMVCLKSLTNCQKNEHV
jgi:hypothetical protein